MLLFLDFPEEREAKVHGKICIYCDTLDRSGMALIESASSTRYATL